MMVAKRSRGRPAGSPTGAKTENFSTRITHDLRERLERAAAEKDVSLSSEVGNRLRKSFEIETREQRTADRFGGNETYGLMIFFAEYIRSVEATSGQKWFEDPYTAQEVRDGLKLILEMLGPKGEPTPPETMLHPVAKDTPLHVMHVFGLFAFIMGSSLDLTRAGGRIIGRAAAPGDRVYSTLQAVKEFLGGMVNRLPKREADQ